MAKRSGGTGKGKNGGGLSKRKLLRDKTKRLTRVEDRFEKQVVKNAEQQRVNFFTAKKG